MMDPLGAPQATRAWATACVTKKEPWKKHKRKGKKMRTTNSKRHPTQRDSLAVDGHTRKQLLTSLQITYTVLWSLEPFTLGYTMSRLCTTSTILPSKGLFFTQTISSCDGLVGLWKVILYSSIHSFSISTHGHWGQESTPTPIESRYSLEAGTFLLVRWQSYLINLISSSCLNQLIIFLCALDHLYMLNAINHFCCELEMYK